ncbi:metallophosphoesterase family protein [Jidongwangia harbinensis]|uniref:metallophosphoesterase family protein n=1 Tax=Jidongwangia harbinensis TaxID=2878561 RepID=UPI001CD9F3C8|nr:metallophosphoesterase [Jidongwangia harbinensis]MCA2219265.1 metallophosphoesterase [Jidongwangia harbinensis]
MQIAHLSDLHLGADSPAVQAAFTADVAAQRVDLAVVSGDLTMRAQRPQFAAARALLDSLGTPWISVPGNHDLPLFRVFERLVAPLANYRRAIGRDTEPVRRHGDVEVLGLNTARPYFWVEGRVDRRQRARIRSAYTGPGLRVLVLHHPVFRSPERPAAHLVRGLRPALRAAADAQVDVILCGHHHVAAHTDLAETYPGLGRHILAVMAGTTSTRVRAGRPQSYQLLTLTGRDRLRLQTRQFDGERFAGHPAGEWTRGPSGWLTSRSPDDSARSR